MALRGARRGRAVMVGGALGLSGAALRGYTRNPLADPGMLGVSSMAALGAVMTFYLGAAISSPWLLPIAAMAGAGLGVALGWASQALFYFFVGCCRRVVYRPVDQRNAVGRRVKATYLRAALNCVNMLLASYGFRTTPMPVKVAGIEPASP